MKLFFKKPTMADFPGGPMVKNLPANEGDIDSVPDSEQLSPGTTTPEA